MEEQSPVPEKTNKFPKWLVTVTPLSKYLAMTLFIALPIFGFYLGMIYQARQTTPPASDISNGTINQNQQKQTKSQDENIALNKCSKYGIDKNKNNLYDSYTVKKGDTLLSVAENQLHDISRAGDIASINQDAYPGLSIKNPFIEVGWKLYLPPAFLKKVTFYGDRPNLLYSENGEITEILDSGMWRYNLDNLNLNSLMRMDNNTLFVGKIKSDYRVGDCITAIMEPESVNALVIKSQ
jgi:hypothetical protein